MDMSDFKKAAGGASSSEATPSASRWRFGILAGYYILGFPIYSSILLAGLFASQTLIAYPIVSKLGIAATRPSRSPSAARSSPTRWPCCCSR